MSLSKTIWEQIQDAISDETELSKAEAADLTNLLKDRLKEQIYTIPLREIFKEIWSNTKHAIMLLGIGWLHKYEEIRKHLYISYGYLLTLNEDLRTKFRVEYENLNALITSVRYNPKFLPYLTKEIEKLETTLKKEGAI